jgi:hypothetical protein
LNAAPMIVYSHATPSSLQLLHFQRGFTTGVLVVAGMPLPNVKNSRERSGTRGIVL